MPGDLAESARMSLNLLFIRWSTRNINLWATDLQSQVLAVGDGDYTAPAGTIAILDAYVTVSGKDLLISPISRSTFAALTNKLTEGDRPTQYYFDRQIIPIINVWPVLKAGASATLKYYRVTRLETVTAAAQTLDAPELWYDAICAGLAARMAEKWAPERLAEKKQEAEAAFLDARRAYRQQVNTRIAPDMSAYRV
jgi:hypothetical protein